MRLIITRHGQTEENIAGIWQGHLPGVLSSLGKEQAEKVALRFKNENINYIYSSDLGRAQDTAKAIAKFHPNTPIEFTEELRERHMGELTGEKIDTVFGKMEEIPVPDMKGGETVIQLCDRARVFLHKILQKHKNDTVLLAGHNQINKALLAVVMGKSYTEIENQKNTAINIFEIDEDKNHKIHLLNDTEHLR